MFGKKKKLQIIYMNDSIVFFIFHLPKIYLTQVFSGKRIFTTFYQTQIWQKLIPAKQPVFFSIQGKFFWNNQTSWSQNRCYDNPKACIKKVAICGLAQTLLLFQIINPLSTNPTKWLNTLKQFLGNNRGIECVWPFCGVAA